MKQRQGYISVEAIIIAGIVTLLGFTIFTESTLSMSSIVNFALNRVSQETQDFSNRPALNLSLEPESARRWVMDNSENLTTSISSGKFPFQTLTINQDPIQLLNLNQTLRVTASVMNASQGGGRAVWAVISGGENIAILCDAMSVGCTSVNITAIKEGTAVVRVMTHDKSVHIDMAITIPQPVPTGFFTEAGV